MLVIANPYWVRRTRQLADCRSKIWQFKAKKKMAEQSKIRHLHVNLQFHKARRAITLGLYKRKRLHHHLSE